MPDKLLSMQLDQIFQNLGLGVDFTETFTLILVLFGLSVVFWFVIGRFRLHNFLINMYVAFALVYILPQSAMFLGKNSQITFFLIFVVFLTLMNKYIFDIHQSGSGLAIWQVVAMSFLELMLLISIIFSLLPEKEILKYISTQSLEYFIGPWWSVCWMILPIGFLIFVKKREW